jgi:two-component system, OmpR family, phosphate regulon response regulator PhoB
VSLRILFADDSVTAQNMGKKILTEAGYEVVAVSNGAAAVKKIAEQKPDIIILDVYMPGYSGLEVCEKVRSSIATIKTPVLLTVGKMEPYRPEDANRVRADGVIIKPFEASDLLAIIKKFEERIGETAVAAPAPAPIRQPVEEIKVQAPETNHEPPPRVIQPMVEVPDHMAASSAFSDLLGTDASRMESFYAPAVAEAAPVKAEAPAVTAAAIDFDLPAPWRQDPEPQPTILETPVASVPAVIAAPVRPIQIPVYQEAELTQFEVVPTAAPPIGDIEIPREAGLQESAEETTRNTVADHRDPDLVPTAHHIPAPAVGPQEVAGPGPAVVTMAVGAAPESSVAVEQATEPETQVISEEPEQLSAAPQHAPSLSEADFEARVAAAMSAYGQAVESRDVLTHAGAAEEPPVFSPATVEQYHEAPPANVEPEPAPSISAEAPTHSVVEESPAAPSIESAAQEIEAPAAPPVISNEVLEIPAQPPAVAHAAAAGVSHETVMASVEAELPSTLQAATHEIEAAAQSTDTSDPEHETIAQAVHRVMERMKDNLVQEIVRELKAKK